MTVLLDHLHNIYGLLEWFYDVQILVEIDFICDVDYEMMSDDPFVTQYIRILTYEGHNEISWRLKNFITFCNFITKRVVQKIYYIFCNRNALCKKFITFCNFITKRVVTERWEIQRIATIAADHSTKETANFVLNN